MHKTQRHGGIKEKGWELHGADSAAPFSALVSAQGFIRKQSNKGNEAAHGNMDTVSQNARFLCTRFKHNICQGTRIKLPS